MLKPLSLGRPANTEEQERIEKCEIWCQVKHPKRIKCPTWRPESEAANA